MNRSFCRKPGFDYVTIDSLYFSCRIHQNGSHLLPGFMGEALNIFGTGNIFSHTAVENPKKNPDTTTGFW
ncbi:hypothetical protein [Methanoregula sp.]|uniref:hypothetical protein n=1 Tax=Methanoregula sp. TaxID=2052170 RepID=UPI003BAFB6FE